MRLLRTDAENLQLKHIEGKVTEPYAILSHTWTDDEVVFADIEKSRIGHVDIESKKGYQKLFLALRQARHDGYGYLWADTCCIDKSSSADLSEAINSMFNYYERAAVCYVYLSDVEKQEDIESSRWFTRGWTLQELLAPRSVMFFSSDWDTIGDKSSLQPLITKITGIPASVLSKKDSLASQSVAKRMSWASSRETSRIEDAAYCLLGIFGINMPLLYGEEDNAFIRLQEEITKVTDDHTLFAWRDPEADGSKSCGLLAESPRFFSGSALFVPCTDLESEEPCSMVNKRLKIEVRFLDVFDQHWGHQLPYRGAVLNCKDIRYPSHKVAITLVSCSVTRKEYRRIRCSELKRAYPPSDTLTFIYVPQIQSREHVESDVYGRDFIVCLNPETVEIPGKLRLLRCTYSIMPDRERHGFGPSDTKTPRFFAGKAHPWRKVVSLDYDCSKMPLHDRGFVTIALGMTEDLKFGYSVRGTHSDLDPALQTSGVCKIGYDLEQFLIVTINHYRVDRIEGNPALFYYYVDIDFRFEDRTASSQGGIIPSRIEPVELP